MPRRPDRRAYRESPYLDDHARSQRDRLAEPRGFGSMLHWFLSGFADETPEEVHAAGAWFGRPPRVDASGQPVEDIASVDPGTGELLSAPEQLTGGSQLGAPRQAEPFRQLLENSPRQTAGDGSDEHYVRPMRAALARLASRTGRGPFEARFLLQVAYAQGDWEAVAERWWPFHEEGHGSYPCLCPEMRRTFAEDALRRLHATYRPQPPIRYIEPPGWVSMSESQRTAIEAGETKGVA